MNRDKMRSTAKFMNTIARVGGKIFMAGGIACAVCTVLVAVFGERMFAVGSHSLELDWITLHLADSAWADMDMMKWFACVGLLGSAAVCFLVYRASVHLCAILTPMEEGRPFEPGVAGHLRKVAWITLIGGLLGQVLGIAEHLILMHTYQIDAFFAAEVVEKVEYSFTIDSVSIWAACLILFLSYIFSYGQRLQQEADETL